MMYIYTGKMIKHLARILAQKIHGQVHFTGGSSFHPGKENWGDLQVEGHDKDGKSIRIFMDEMGVTGEGDFISAEGIAWGPGSEEYEWDILEVEGLQNDTPQQAAQKVLAEIISEVNQHGWNV
jgi:hypothetical protein